mgnify:CR=1 FL=1
MQPRSTDFKQLLAEFDGVFHADCSLNLGDDPAAAILRDAKVAVVPGPDMGGENYKNFIRFNFATSKEQISDAIDRIAAIRG